MGAFKEPHGGELKQLYLSEDAAEVRPRKTPLTTRAGI